MRATLRRLPLSRMFPGLSPGGVLAGLRENLSRLVPAERVDLATALNEILARQKELFTAQSLRGAWEVVAGLGSGARELVERRLRGDYVVDEYGLDEEFLDLCRPFLKFMYRRWWRIQTTGIENIPGRGRALLVANHSGTVPWDAVMLAWAVQEEHPAPRYVRTLYLDWLTRLPFMSTLVTRTGQVLACPENAERLLGQDQLVAVFPEGLKGIGKAYAQRYRVARFGRGGFARVALRTGAPIIPVSIVGAEEIYPMLYRVDTLAKLVGMPYFPITPTFPWLGLLGLVPLPTRWRIRVGEPIRTDTYGAKGADSFVAVEAVANRTRDAIQRQIDESLAARKSVFR
ncbi:MAG: acyltransferase family protein [Planctomycetes bacterium]|nr:acyltransferase family protein [Planctomycetota bacterium]